MTDVVATSTIRRSAAEYARAGTHQLGFSAAFALSGLLFLLYPAVRPFSSEVGLDGARAFGSASWVVAHSLGIGAFILLGLGSLGLYLRLHATAVGGRMLAALTLIWERNPTLGYISERHRLSDK